MATEDIRERLTKLPHHAVVAFAARCARRVQPLTHVLPQQDRDAIDRAITSAEVFAKGAAEARAAEARAATRADDARAAAARAAAAAWTAARAADAARADAAKADARAADAAEAANAAAAWAATTTTAAAWAADAAAWADARAAASSDLDRLIALHPGELDPLGAPIDPSEDGPLGPIWPHGVPEWYTETATGTVTLHEEPSGDAD